MWLDPANPQLNKNGELHHLLSLEGLPADILRQILDTAESFVGVTQREVKKVPLLRGKAVFNLFFEASTRTRTTFEIAAKRLSADVINLAINVSSQSKGETVLDTVANLSAMQADMFIVRHAASGAQRQGRGQAATIIETAGGHDGEPHAGIAAEQRRCGRRGQTEHMPVPAEGPLQPGLETIRSGGWLAHDVVISFSRSALSSRERTLRTDSRKAGSACISAAGRSGGITAN